MKRMVSILVILLFLTTMASCIAVGSGGSKKADHQTTLGQELIDLQKARDEGAISQQEYEELKEKLKKSYE
ncbi:hypothetical protein D1AOALGA4SA_3306 [Olavius algarvensis Delta 1 endosymbiont]|nr:hypothetical protein D1AOALGA4SA_3306 [Olavius algarvensis Delta 1 endosymbiont]